MSSLTGTSKLSTSFEAAVNMLQQAAGGAGAGGAGGVDGSHNTMTHPLLPTLPPPPHLPALFPTDITAASVLVRDAVLRTRAVQRDSRVLLSLYVPSDHLFALYAP